MPLRRLFRAAGSSGDHGNPVAPFNAEGTGGPILAALPRRISGTLHDHIGADLDIAIIFIGVAFLILTQGGSLAWGTHPRIVPALTILFSLVALAGALHILHCRTRDRRFGIPTRVWSAAPAATRLSRLQAELGIATKLVQSLLRSDHLYRTLVGASPNAVVLIDSGCVIEFASPRAHVMLGVPADEPLRGRSLHEFLPAHDRQRTAERLLRVVDTHEMSECECRFVRTDGTAFDVALSAAAWRIPQRNDGGVVLFLRDLTTDKKRAARLKASEARFATIFRSNPVGTLLTRFTSGGIVDVNDALVRLSGHERRALLKRNLDDLVVCPQTTPLNHLLERLRRDGRIQNAELGFRHSSGTVLQTLGSLELLELEGEQFVLSMFIDVTAASQAQAELRASEERFRDVVETISEVFWVLDPSRNRVVYVSPNFARMWGRRPEDVYSSDSVWIASVQAEDRDRVAAAAAAHARTGGFNETYRITRADGATRWIRDQSFPILDAEGRVKRIVGVARDVTEEKALEKQLLQSQRLEAVGTLASGVAHDINNILAPFLIIPRLLKPKLASAHDGEMLEMLHNNARRGAEIAKQLLAFSRGGDSQRAPMSITPIIKQMAAIMRETFPREITIEVSMVPDVPSISGNPTEIHQVIMNLCVNARDAMPDGGTLRLRISCQEVMPDGPRPHAEANPGRYVVLSVGDTGKGITPEIVDRIFDPFFTTKTNGHGTGLGLSTVRGIVKAHHGFVVVDTEPGHGAEFRVYLPVLARDSHDASASVELPAGTAGNGELVLIVDDEEAVRIALEYLLKQHGYSTIAAPDGAQALTVLASRAGAVKVVITDIMMPHSGGIAVIEEIRKRYPHLPVIAATGLADARAIRALKDLGVREILGKPFAPETMAAAVGRCINGKAPDAR